MYKFLCICGEFQRALQSNAAANGIEAIHDVALDVE